MTPRELFPSLTSSFSETIQVSNLSIDSEFEATLSIMLYSSIIEDDIHLNIMTFVYNNNLRHNIPINTGDMTPFFRICIKFHDMKSIQKFNTFYNKLKLKRPKVNDVVSVYRAAIKVD